MKQFTQFMEEIGDFLAEKQKPPGTYEVHVTPVQEAEMYLQREAPKALEFLTDFRKNYKRLQDVINKYSLGKQRRDMPRITQKDIKDLKKRLEKGKLDIKEPYAMGLAHALSPDQLKQLESGDGVSWLSLGHEDGNKKDDKIKVEITRMKAGKLKPIQTQIYFSNVAFNMAKFGPPTGKSNKILDRIMVVSSDGYIIDGHHRWATLMVSDPSLKIKALVVSLNIEELLKITLGSCQRGRAGTCIGSRASSARSSCSRCTSRKGSRRRSSSWWVASPSRSRIRSGRGWCTTTIVQATYHGRAFGAHGVATGLANVARSARKAAPRPRGCEDLKPQ